MCSLSSACTGACRSVSWFFRSLAAVAVIEETGSVRERNDTEDRDALAGPMVLFSHGDA